jgi:hypothetical protein
LDHFTKNKENGEMTRVDFGEFERAIRDSGLKFEELASWVKVKGPDGRRVYVPRTQTVSRVMVAGFRWAEGSRRGAVEDLDEPAGSVEQVLVFDDLDPQQIVQNFRDLVEHMRGLPPLERPARRRAAGTTSPPPEALADAQRRGVVLRQRRGSGRPTMTPPAAVAADRMDQGKPQEG